MTWDEVEKSLFTPEEIAENKRIVLSYIKVRRKPKGRHRQAYKWLMKDCRRGV